MVDERAGSAAALGKMRYGDKPRAPRTIWNKYSCVCALFRDAVFEEVIDQNPCILTEHHLGPKEDKDPAWRGKALYKREEAAALLADPRVPHDRRVLNALLFLGALRHGEAAGIRWSEYDTSTTTLGQLQLITSYAKGRTKTRVARAMPVHPTLASILKDWRDRGWEELMERVPTPDDLIVPMPKTARGDAGRMRMPQRSLKLHHRDCDALEIRQRRLHDFRRSLISLARSDGADKDILRRGTHKAPTDVMEGYTTFEWDVLCREVLKLKFELPSALTGTGNALDPATVPATVAAEKEKAP